MKSIVRKIVLSSTYSQSRRLKLEKSIGSKEPIPRKISKLRLSAEAIRDNARQLLEFSLHLYGPPFTLLNPMNLVDSR